ncbi:MAG: haloacid dehalogenase-like hydrolase [Deltaproteobacteria bacterium]|jgi:phosphoserine phosphatase|nr:haloacid dehalogenase-like hydrolase [Deltaproteobacteria bacterium]
MTMALDTRTAAFFDLDRTLLDMNSSTLWAKAARAARDTWRLDDFLSNDFPADDQGNLIGTFARPLCYGRGKVERAQTWATERDIDLAECYFYTDSYTDAPMLRAVGHPRVVRPDPRLSRAARQGSWPVLQW